MNHITKNTLKNYTVLKAGYCELYATTKACVELGHNFGFYGWNYGAYRIPGSNIVIVTGYRTGNVEGLRIPDDLSEELEKKARALYEEIGECEKFKIYCWSLFYNFINELKARNLI